MPSKENNKKRLGDMINNPEYSLEEEISIREKLERDNTLELKRLWKRELDLLYRAS